MLSICVIRFRESTRTTGLYPRWHLTCNMSSWSAVHLQREYFIVCDNYFARPSGFTLNGDHINSLLLLEENRQPTIRNQTNLSGLIVTISRKTLRSFSEPLTAMSVLNMGSGKKLFATF